MSNHNYSQYSKRSENHVTDATEVRDVAPEITVTPAVVELPEFKMESEPTVPEVPKTSTGVVVNCAKLNVRANPTTNAEVLCVLNVDSYVEVNLEKSTKEWFKVCTANGVDGYCMRKFINVNP